MGAISGLRTIRGLVLAAGLAALAGCGSSGGGASVMGNTGGCDLSDPAAAGSCGKVVVALTDADGDFTTYTVDVLSISLERADGQRIEMLPQTARVDFAALTDLSELISTATVVPGDFVGAHLRLDYSDAEIYAQAGDDSNPVIVPVRVYDNDGRLLTDNTPNSVVDVQVTLPDTARLIVTPGHTAMLSVDFDLAASHAVDTSTNPATAVAQPFLAAEVRPVDQKDIRVRGALDSVDLGAGTYDIRVRPWYHRSGDYGSFTVITNDATAFDIDDASYTGGEGLRALADEPAGTLTVAYGTLDLGTHSFTADTVEAGDSVGGTRYSAVTGNIVSRDGDRLVIKGGFAIRRDRRAHFQRTIVVDVGPDTEVTKTGFPDGAFDTGNLSVGQRTTFFGDIMNPLVDNTDRFGPDTALMLDATEGRARMLVTELRGEVSTLQSGGFEMRLRAIDRLGAGMFDFTGTGIAPEQDADPGAYEVATSTLPLDALVPSRPVRVLGFVAPYGEAPPDFEGRTLVGPRDLPAALGVAWGTAGTAAPFSAMGPESLVIDLANLDIGERHHILIGRELIDLFDLPASPSIEESGLPRVYGIWEPGHIELFKNFADFVDALSMRLSNTDRAQAIAAYGRYSTGENRLSANKVVVHMLPTASAGDTAP